MLVLKYNHFHFPLIWFLLVPCACWTSLYRLQIWKLSSSVLWFTHTVSVFFDLILCPDDLDLVARLLLAVNLGNTSGKCCLLPMKLQKLVPAPGFWLVTALDCWSLFFVDLNSWIISYWACVNGDVSPHLVFRSFRSCWCICYVPGGQMYTVVVNFIYAH